MKKSKNTKGLVGSVDYIDSDELVILRKKNNDLERQLEEVRESFRLVFLENLLLHEEINRLNENINELKEK